MSEQEIAREIAKLRDLTQELTTRLRQRVPAHGVPFTSPPRDIRRVRLELTGERERNDELVHEALDGKHGDHAQDGLCETPRLEEEHDLEEGDEHDDSNGVSDGREDGAEFLAAHAEKRTHATRHTEETS